MKQIFVILLSIFAMSGIASKAIAQERERTVQLSVGAETRGFTLSYEQKVLNFSAKHSVSLRGFVGYGFNSSNWTEDTSPDQRPGKSWRFSTYYPFEKNREVGRHTYYLGDLKQYSAGIELNYRLGKKKHFLELAESISLDYFSRKVNFYASRSKLGATPSYEDLQNAEASKFATHYTTRLGYRFVANNGFTIGAGLSLHSLEGIFTHFYAASEQIMPYLSIGYSF